MAQYTKLQAEDIRGILSKYELDLSGYESIEEGAGSSNFLVRSNRKQYILTVFEIVIIYD